MDPFLQAVLKTPPLIFGRRLQPLSAFHCMLLQEFGSPLMLEGVTVDMVDYREFCEAVYICGLTWEDGPKEIAKITETDDALHAIFNQFSGLEVDEKAIKTLINYVSDYLYAPEVYQKENFSGQSGIPWYFKIVGDLVSETSMSESRCWNMPISLAIAYRTNIAENNGFKVFSAQDREDLAKLKAIREAEEKAEAENG